MHAARTTRTHIGLSLLLLSVTSVAEAGIPECGDIRLEDAQSCELRGDLACSAGCDELGVYKKACATKLHTVCRSECTLDADASCTDECTVQCTADCDAGVNVICTHNCFGECVGSCEASCADAVDGEQCMATCEATCDGECDIKCRPLVDGACYTHCIECCGGSCTAQANMSCQNVCQEEEFETCELEFRADCSASCTGDGALFCDGEYVLAGSELPGCIQALIERGTYQADVQGDAEAEVEATGVACAFTAQRGSNGGLFGALLVTLFAGLLGRRRSR